MRRSGREQESSESSGEIKGEVVWACGKGERDVVRRAMDCPVIGKRNRGRQPRRWKDWVEARMKELGVGREDELDRKRWRGIVAADLSGEGRG